MGMGEENSEEYVAAGDDGELSRVKAELANRANRKTNVIASLVVGLDAQIPQIFEVHHKKGIKQILEKYVVIGSGAKYAYPFFGKSYVEGLSCAHGKVLAENTIVFSVLKND
ncbi:hypothetical protein ACE6H2_022841 [Prunus campanulata]